MRFGVKATIVVLALTYFAILGAALLFGPHVAEQRQPEPSAVVDPMGCM